MDAVVLEFAGVDSPGSNGSGAVVQSVFGEQRGVSSLSLGL